MTYRFRKTFRTGHGIFDEVSSFQIGSTVCIFDETQTESIFFLESLFTKQKEMPIYLLAAQPIETSFRLNIVDVTKSLNEININIAEFREKIGRGIIIHHYLPRILLRDSEDDILKMLEHWADRISGRNFLEFYTLPKETFPSFEKRLKTIANVVININITKVGETYQQTFSLLRGSKPEYHLTEFPYKIENGRLLIMWRDEYIDYLPKEEEAEIKRIKQYIANNLYRLKIKKGPLKSQRTRELLFLSHLVDKRLDEIQEIFPERFDSILDTLARWKIRGFISFDEVDKKEPKPLKKYLKLRNRLALKMPLSISLMLLRLSRNFRKEKIRYIPYDGYLSLKSSAETLIRLVSSESPEMIERLLESEMFMQEIVGRQTAVEHAKSLGESPLIKFDERHIPKICSLALYHGYGLRTSVKKEESNVFKIKVKNCFICEGVSSDRPVCQLLSSTIVGVLSVIFNEEFTCVETECRAKGDEQCVFTLRML